ncbi:MAG: hypothetical protein JG766_2010, partial [Desulfacinum sp.]|nr:hypothetical protein [Desulfacinum sp.]
MFAVMAAFGLGRFLGGSVFGLGGLMLRRSMGFGRLHVG